jgi:hypothetical protein
VTTIPAFLRAQRYSLSVLRLVVLTTVVVPAIGCQEAEDGRGPEVLPLRTAEPDLRIGSLDDADYSFSYANALEVAPDGSIYSLHRQETLIRKWTADGIAAGVVGRSGEGPGEYGTIAGLFRSPGDTLHVFDSRLLRVTVLDGAGRPLQFRRELAIKADAFHWPESLHCV